MKNFPSMKPGWPTTLALVTLVGVVYWPVLSFDFVRWDDDISITQNALLTDPWSPALIGQFFTGDQALRFKPLHWFCFRLLHAAFGFSPTAWHAFNLGLHAAATALLYVVLCQVFCLFAPAKGKNPAKWGAWLGAALWAVHPLRAEVVAWATASGYSLTAVGLLASFACYLKAQTESAFSRRWLVLAWLFAVAAYGSFPVGVTYGLWLLVVDRWLLSAVPSTGRPGKLNWNWAWVAKHAWFLAPAALAVGITLWSRFTAPGIFPVAPTVQSVGMLSRLTMALASLTYFARCLFWPADLTPNMPQLEVVSGDAQLLVMAGLALLGIAIAWRGRQQHPSRSLVWLGFVALALPCLGWTELPRWPMDRYSYIVHLVLVGGLTGWIVCWAGDIRSRRITAIVGAAALLLISTWAARAQIMIWQDSPALFTHMERHSHFAYSPRQQGHVYILWARYEAAADHPVAAVKLFNRAQQVYFTAIQTAVARQEYSEALALSTHLEHHFTLTPIMRRERGAWLLRLERRPEALVELQLARTALPDDARIKSLLEEAQK